MPKSLVKPTVAATGSWRDELVVFFAAFAVLGPLALPLLWMNRSYGYWFKFWLSVAAILFTLALIGWTWYLYQNLLAKFGAADGTALWAILQTLAQQRGN